MSINSTIIVKFLLYTVSILALILVGADALLGFNCGSTFWGVFFSFLLIMIPFGAFRAIRQVEQI